MMSLHIVVCIKQVPVSNNLKIDPVTKNVIRSDAQGMMNPFDKNAIEAALDLKERHDGEVTLLSMGPKNFEITLREGLAMGADRAILLSSRAFGGADTLATGYVLSEAIKKIGNVDLIFFGRQSIDADTGQVGPIVAEFLDMPQATYIHEINPVQNGKILATRLMENMEQVIEVEIPAVITVRSELNEPRYPTLRNIQKSYQKEVEVWDENQLAADPNRIGIKGSPTIVRKVWTPENQKKVAESLGNHPDAAVQKLLEILRDKNIL
ncbi:MAG: electron transfer flavoprotein subunit beta/FixA family protein [Acholeplasmataceae bacterium]|nr:electron transfer flavoprotein subunit beta/FixA family protein [Acholeplasmataceae bacterium]